MTAWAQGQHTRYLIPSESGYFAKLALALAVHEVDEALIDRQRAEWLDDLKLMLRAQAPRASTPQPLSSLLARA